MFFLVFLGHELLEASLYASPSLIKEDSYVKALTDKLVTRESPIFVPPKFKRTLSLNPFSYYSVQEN
jgi:hypothetical protein